MTNREELIEHIRNWVSMDNELKNLRKSVKELNTKKKEISNTLIQVMKENDINTIDMNDGKLLYKKTIVKAPISKKHLLQCLQDFYKNDTEMVNELSTHILESRETKTFESIKHKN